MHYLCSISSSRKLRSSDYTVAAVSETVIAHICCYMVCYQCTAVSSAVQFNMLYECLYQRVQLLAYRYCTNTHTLVLHMQYVEAAGMFMCDEDGQLVQLYPHSGHYRPSDGHLYNLLRYFESAGIDLSAVQVDAQRTYKTARPENDGEKVRKVSSSYNSKECKSSVTMHCVISKCSSAG
jgi:hypothetical protein